MNTETPYAKFGHDALILRDYLAIDRTELANERTILAYVRTSLAFMVVGGSLIRFLDSLFATVAGGVFFAVGITLLIVGAVRFYRIRRKIVCAKISE